MKNLEQFFDIIVVGAGHAGCEASLACARLGLNTVMFTVSVDSIALMPCNPNIGGDDLYAGIVKQCSFRKYLCSTLQPDHGPVAGGF